jgi:hypothetical protein
MSKRLMTAGEIEALQTLDVAIPTGDDASNPISCGIPELYASSELKKKLKGDQTGRTDRFTKLLIGLRLRLKGPVPYAFKTPDGAVRSLDAGCLGFLHHSKSQQISFICNADGKITHVDLVDGAFASLEPIHGKLEKTVTPINS